MWAGVGGGGAYDQNAQYISLRVILCFRELNSFLDYFGNIM